jgi:hypothetical protein
MKTLLIILSILNVVHNVNRISLTLKIYEDITNIVINTNNIVYFESCTECE